MTPLTFPTPLAERQQHDPIDLAVRDVEMAGADFIIAILAAQSVDTCLRLHHRVERLITGLDAISSSALDRANQLCRKKD